MHLCVVNADDTLSKIMSDGRAIMFHFVYFMHDKTNKLPSYISACASTEPDPSLHCSYMSRGYFMQIAKTLIRLGESESSTGLDIFFCVKLSIFYFLTHVLGAQRTASMIRFF